MPSISLQAKLVRLHDRKTLHANTSDPLRQMPITACLITYHQRLLITKAADAQSNAAYEQCF
jgi:hypothetical protein